MEVEPELNELLTQWECESDMSRGMSRKLMLEGRRDESISHMFKAAYQDQAVLAMLEVLVIIKRRKCKEEKEKSSTSETAPNDTKSTAAK